MPAVTLAVMPWMMLFLAELALHSWVMGPRAFRPFLRAAWIYLSVGMGITSDLRVAGQVAWMGWLEWMWLRLLGDIWGGRM